MRVRDLRAARPWYEQLLGEPAFLPNESEVVWTVAGYRSICIREEPESAGGVLATVFVDDLDAAAETAYRLPSIHGRQPP